MVTSPSMSDDPKPNGGGTTKPGTAERCVGTARGIVLATVILIKIAESIGGRDASAPLTVLCLVALGYALATSGATVFGREHPRLRLPLLVVDIILISGLIQLEEGAQSELYVLYYLPILQAGVRLSLRDAVAAALLSAAFYALVILSNGPQTQLIISGQIRTVTFGGSAVLLATVFGLLSRDVRQELARQLTVTRLSEAICLRADAVGIDPSHKEQPDALGVTGPLATSLQMAATAPSSVLRLMSAALGARHRLMWVEATADNPAYWVISSPTEGEHAEAARRLAEKVIGPSTTNGHAFVIERLASEKSLKHLGSPIRSLIVVPLWLGKRRLATVVLCDKDPTATSPDDFFTEFDLRTACALAPQAALLLDYARVHHNMSSVLRRSVGTLAAAIDAKDPDTRGHSERVAFYATFLAGEMGLPPETIEAVELAAVLHDIGKIGMEDSLLRGKTTLHADDWGMIRQHPVIGARIFEALDELEFMLPALRSHHERWDGTGYPDGLAGEELPLLARIVSIADAFEAMTFGRSYRPVPLTFREACDEILDGAGTQFDPELARLFVERATPDLPRRAHSGNAGSPRPVEELVLTY